MNSTKIDNSMKNILKTLKHENNSSKQDPRQDEYSFFSNQKQKKADDYTKPTSVRAQDDRLQNAIKTHPLLAKMNKTSKETSELTNIKSSNTIKSIPDNEKFSSDTFSILKTPKKEPELSSCYDEIKKKETKKPNKNENINFFINKESNLNYFPEEDQDYENFDDEIDVSQDIKINELNDSCANNNQNNNNYYKQAPYKIISRTDCSPNDHNNATMYNYCTSEMRKKFQRANHVFYNGFLNKQDKSSTLPEYQAHAAELLHFLKSLWMTNTMCDLVIMIGNRKYSAHRLGLAMFSHKYRDEFQRQLQNKNTGVYTICLKNSKTEALEYILKYIYTAKIDINPSNVEDILRCAKELGIDDLICMAKDYLSSLSMGDVLDFMSNIFNKEGAELMFYELYSYMMTHLEKISRTPEYYKASISVVKTLLKDSHLSVCSELEVFEAAVRWINFDKSREKLLGEVMRNIRFTLMSPDELVSKVESQAHLINEPEIQKMIYNAFKFHALNSSRSNLNGICQKEEARNFCLEGASVPDEFVKAVIELSDIAHKLKESRNFTTSNLINCDDSDDFVPSRCKPVKNIFNINNNNNSDMLKSAEDVSGSFFKPKFEELVKKISKDFSKLKFNQSSDNESKCTRCKNCKK